MISRRARIRLRGTRGLRQAGALLLGTVLTTILE